MTNNEIDIRDYYNLIRKDLYKYPKQYHDEITQAGVEALVKAKASFDGSVGASFATYASYKVHFAMLAAYQRLTQHGNVVLVTFTDIESSMHKQEGEDLNIEDVLPAQWQIEDFVSGLTDSSVILSEVDCLQNKLQRISMRYLSGLRDHAKVKNKDLARILGLGSMHVTQTYYEAKKKLKTRPAIIELAMEKGILKRV